MSVLQEWVSEVSCHRLVDTCPITNAILHCSRNVAIQEKVTYFQIVYYAHYVVLIIDDTGEVKGKGATYTVQLKCTSCLLYRILLASEMWIYPPTLNMNTVTIRHVYLV